MATQVQQSPGRVFWQTPFSKALCPEVLIHIESNGTQDSCILGPGNSELHPEPTWTRMRRDCQFSGGTFAPFLLDNRFFIFAITDPPPGNDEERECNIYSSWNAIDWEEEGTVPFWPLAQRAIAKTDDYLFCYGKTGNPIDGYEQKIYRSTDGINWTCVNSSAFQHRDFQSIAAINGTLVLLGGYNQKNLEGTLTQDLGYTIDEHDDYDHEREVYLHTDTEDYTYPILFEAGCEIMRVQWGGTSTHYTVYRFYDGTSCEVITDPLPPHYEIEHSEGDSIKAIESRRELTDSIFVSYDDGVTWTKSGTIPDGAVQEPSVINFDSHLFMSANDKIYKSSDGLAWSTVCSDILQYIPDIAPHYEKSAGALFQYQNRLHMYATSSSGGFPPSTYDFHLISADGQTWQRYKDWHKSWTGGLNLNLYGTRMVVWPEPD